MDIQKLDEGTGDNLPALTCSEKEKSIDSGAVDIFPLTKLFYPENPVITLCQSSLHENKHAWSTLNLAKKFDLPPLNDESLRNAIFCKKGEPFCTAKGTNYAFGFQFGESGHLRSQADTKMLEVLYPFPTLLPPLQFLFFRTTGFL